MIEICSDKMLIVMLVSIRRVSKIVAFDLLGLQMHLEMMTVK